MAYCYSTVDCREYNGWSPQKVFGALQTTVDIIESEIITNQGQFGGLLRRAATIPIMLQYGTRALPQPINNKHLTSTTLGPGGSFADEKRVYQVGQGGGKNTFNNIVDRDTYFSSDGASELASYASNQGLAIDIQSARYFYNGTKWERTMPHLAPRVYTTGAGGTHFINPLVDDEVEEITDWTLFGTRIEVPAYRGIETAIVLMSGEWGWGGYEDLPQIETVTRDENNDEVTTITDAWDISTDRTKITTNDVMNHPINLGMTFAATSRTVISPPVPTTFHTISDMLENETNGHDNYGEFDTGVFDVPLPQDSNAIIQLVAPPAALSNVGSIIYGRARNHHDQAAYEGVASFPSIASGMSLMLQTYVIKR